LYSVSTGDIQGPEKTEDTCRKTMHRETMNRSFNVKAKVFVSGYENTIFYPPLVLLTLSNGCKAGRAQSTATLGCAVPNPHHKAITSLQAAPRCWVSTPTCQ
jgi:hypothetical protein